MIKTSKKALVYLAPAILALGLTACGQSPVSDSAVKVTNGIAIQDKVYPSTILLVSVTAEGEAICTGTFVNDSQVVTAGHCVQGLSETSPQIFYATETNGNMQALAQAVSFSRNPDYSFADGVNEFDVSVINFPANTAPAFSPIADATPNVGDQFVIVGYGNNANFISAGTLDGQGAGVKRAGTNFISANDNGMLSFAGLTGTETTPVDGVAAGQYVSSGAGDSGGPLFVNDKLAGVTSGGGLSHTQEGTDVAISRYVDLNSASSRAFLAKAIKRTTNSTPAPLETVVVPTGAANGG